MSRDELHNYHPIRGDAHTRAQHIQHNTKKIKPWKSYNKYKPDIVNNIVHVVMVKWCVAISVGFQVCLFVHSGQ